MGRVASRLMKPVRMFNIENRATRALEKQHAEGIASPKHPSTREQISQIQRDHPEILTEQQEKNEALHQRLKGLYVESETAPVMKSSTRPLPESRAAHPETELGSMETQHTIPEGRSNLKTVLAFLNQHRIDPETFSPQAIAQEHSLRLDEVQHVLSHFKALTLHIPQEMYDKNPNMKKIVAQQIEAASHSVSQIRLSLPSDSAKLDSGPKKG